MIRKARSVALAFELAAAGTWVAPVACAQSTTTGNIYGAIGNPAGTEDVVLNEASGVKRTVKPDASGR